jgi:YHS domain
MRFRLMAGAAGLAVLLGGFGWGADTDKDQAAAKTALQALNEFVGPWKGTGESKEGKNEIWKESLSWSWSFKGDAPSLVAEFTDSKQFNKGELRYLPDKKSYQFTLVDKNKKELVFEGEYKKKYLTLTRVDADSKDKQVIQMSTNNDGARFIYTYAVQSKGKGLERKLFQVSHAKEGVSLASAKKNECIVTGGLGTRTVSYMGKTYYVCCSGCADAFNENPKKFIDEYEKRKK